MAAGLLTSLLGDIKSATSAVAPTWPYLHVSRPPSWHPTSRSAASERSTSGHAAPWRWQGCELADSVMSATQPRMPRCRVATLEIVVGCCSGRRAATSAAHAAGDSAPWRRASQAPVSADSASGLYIWSVGGTSSSSASTAASTRACGDWAPPPAPLALRRAIAELGSR
ncbi:MAG: hypothetical protein J3K34DRAFT_409373 [Monoraphidium minutum]|nr:MAG: hypothetical protein J3K34DRAFT_409373 [Monoraphidium minutum]